MRGGVCGVAGPACPWVGADRILVTLLWASAGPVPDDMILCSAPDMLFLVGVVKLLNGPL